MSEEPDIKETPTWFKLEKKAMVAELRLLIIASVALNQFLMQVELPQAVSLTAISAAILYPAGKALLAILTRH